MKEISRQGGEPSMKKCGQCTAENPLCTLESLAQDLSKPAPIDEMQMVQNTDGSY